jgi:hypothetical protein
MPWNAPSATKALYSAWTVTVVGSTPRRFVGRFRPGTARPPQPRGNPHSSTVANAVDAPECCAPVVPVWSRVAIMRSGQRPRCCGAPDRRGVRFAHLEALASAWIGGDNGSVAARGESHRHSGSVAATPNRASHVTAPGSVGGVADSSGGRQRRRPGRGAASLAAPSRQAAPRLPERGRVSTSWNSSPRLGPTTTARGLMSARWS